MRRGGGKKGQKRTMRGNGGLEPKNTNFFFFLPLEFCVLRFDFRKLEGGGRGGGMREISKLSQQAGENLGTYYKRANSLLIQTGSRDRETPFMTMGEALNGESVQNCT